jgi:hypothetical protein
MNEKMALVRDAAAKELVHPLATLSSDPRYCLNVEIKTEGFVRSGLFKMNDCTDKCLLSIRYWVNLDKKHPEKEVKEVQDVGDGVELPEWK